MIQSVGVVMLGVFLLSSSSTRSQTRERSSIPPEYTWDLTDLYASDEAWREAKAGWEGRLGRLEAYRGTLHSSARRLLECLDEVGGLNRELQRLSSYAGNASNQDTRASEYIAMVQEIRQLATRLSTLTSFVEPELVAMDESTIDGFLEDEPGLEPYAFRLRDLMRRKKHTLSEAEERILAEAGRMAGAPSSVYNIFSNAEMPYPEATLHDGSTIVLNQANFARARALPNRGDREMVFRTFFEALKRFRGTFGAKTYAKVNADIFYANTRGYEDCLEMSLDGNNIPKTVYYGLIENVNKNLDMFQRYLAIKKRMLGVDTLKYSDLYAPTVKGVNLEYDIDEAKALILESLRPLGEEYVSVVKKALGERWIDMYPTEGKRSGAYSNDGAYGVHPYILMNYTGLYNDVSTLTHELGHSLHTYFAYKTQTFPTADYSTFVAEVASTLNEVLLKQTMLGRIRDDDVRLSLLMEDLDGIKGTLFRQTQFAEYELRIHERVEQGGTLTGDIIAGIYRDIVRRYYGHDEGVCLVPDFIDYEWTYVHHFIGYTYYVYQYATSFTASAALGEKILSGEKNAVDRYLAFLSAGGSDYPIAILKKAGVDMTTPDPFRKTMDAMVRTMDEIERILDKKGL